MVDGLENNIYLVNAPAGSGKTTWIRKQVENHLLSHENDNVLCITYTNRAAEELGKDLETNKAFFGTIHSFINEFISSFFSHRAIIDLYWELYKEQILVRIENKEQKDTIKESNEKYIENFGSLDLETVYENIEAISYGEAPFTSLYRGALSHDDLISFTRIAVDRYPIIKKKISDKYQLIFIDEYQDTAADVLHIFYSAMQGKNGKMYFLGDKMQQIYKTYDGSFEEEFKRLNRSEKLDTNYRTTPYIVNILNKIYNDDRLEQKPYEKNTDSSMDFLPKVIFSNEIEKTISEFTTEYENTLVLYLSNKERFYGIGAGKLFDSYNSMEKYRFGGKYTAVDVLTKDDVRENDVLLKFLFLTMEVCNHFRNQRYGEVFRTIKKNAKLINTKEYLIQNHADKKVIKEKLEKLDLKYKDEYTKIGDLLNECKSLKFLSQEYYEQIIEEENYNDVLEVNMVEVKNLLKYLDDPKISTQHGVKGESHDTVLFVAENNNNNPVVHMNKFFEVWSSMNIALPEFEAFYYSYVSMIHSIEQNCGLKVSDLKAGNYGAVESKILEAVNNFRDVNCDNDYYINLVSSNIDKFLQNPNVTNAKSCLKENLVYGSLSAYRLFYVGCSRARKNLAIVIDNKDVESFKENLQQKFKTIGFKVVV